MTKAQVIKALEQYPDDMDVFMAERKTDFAYGLVNSVTSKPLTFLESEDDTSNDFIERNGEEPPMIDCIILDEQ